MSSVKTKNPKIKLSKTLVLVGLMGAGKSTVGRRIAKYLGVPFRDADDEIEAAAGCSVSDIFSTYGEAEFRRGERQVIARLLKSEPVHVLATGGGAFMNPETRAEIKENAYSVWLSADLETLVERCGRRNNRPLLQTSDPSETLKHLMEERYPIYAEADVIVDSTGYLLEEMVDQVVAALHSYDTGKVTRSKKKKSEILNSKGP